MRWWSYPQGIAPPASTDFHALPQIAAPDPHTCGHARLPYKRFHPVKAVAAACGLFAAAPGGARHPRFQQLHEQRESGWTDMRLFLCEKPSQGKDIGRILGATQRGEGCLNGSGVTVTWCIGHLVEAAAPEVYDAALKRWSLEQLPIIPALPGQRHWPDSRCHAAR